MTAGGDPESDAAFEPPAIALDGSTKPRWRGPFPTEGRRWARTVTLREATPPSSYLPRAVARIDKTNWGL